MKLIKLPTRDGIYINADKIIALEPHDNSVFHGGIFKSALMYEKTAGKYDYLYFEQSYHEVAESIRAQLLNWG